MKKKAVGVKRHVTLFFLLGGVVVLRLNGK